MSLSDKRFYAKHSKSKFYRYREDDIKSAIKELKEEIVEFIIFRDQAEEDKLLSKLKEIFGAELNE